MRIANTVTEVPEMSPAPEWLTDMMDGRTYYEERMGWPVVTELTARRLAVRSGESLDAITMPRTLGQHVHAELCVALLAGPVLHVSEPEGECWTFLTQRCPEGGPDVGDDLRRRQVCAVPRGELIALPVPQGTGEPTWVHQPSHHSAMPPRQAVLSAARRVLTRTEPISPQRMVATAGEQAVIA
jgi:hypothetical protein